MYSEDLLLDDPVSNISVQLQDFIVSVILMVDLMNISQYSGDLNIKLVC